MKERLWRDRSTRRQTCRRATQSTTNPTCLGLRSNAGFSGSGPANGRLAAQCLRVLVWTSLHVTRVGPKSVRRITDFLNKKVWTPHFVYMYMEANVAWMEELSSCWPDRRRNDDDTCYLDRDSTAGLKAAIVPTICNKSLGSMSSNAIINGTIRLNPAGADGDLDVYLLISNQ
jgi:hypothetical protein